MQNLLYTFRLSLFSVLILVSVPAMATELLAEWSVEQVLSSPESAAFDPQTGSIFVSNVNGYAKDGNGFISRFSADGLEQEIEWLSGLDSPTGIAIYQGKLYFADYDRLVVANTIDGTILDEYPAPDSKPSLNDVAVSADGQVFVSGSSSNSIYSLEDGELRVWKKDDNLLAMANGLFVRGQVLVHGGARWAEFDIQSKELLVSNLETTEFKDFDGIADDGCGGYLLTLIDDKRIWHMSADRQIKPLVADPINGIDLQNHENTLYVPRVGDGFAKYSLTPDYCNYSSE